MNVYVRMITWFFLIFIGFEALGLREQGASGLGNQSAGIYGFLQIAFLLILFISPVIYFTYLSKIKLTGHLSVAIHLIFFLFIIELCLNSFSLGGYPVSRLLYNFYSLKYYLVFFFISLWYRDMPSLKELMDVLLVAAVISAVVFLFFAFVYEFPSVIKKLTSDQIGRELRFLVPMGMLMAYGLFYQVAQIIYLGKTPTRIITTAILLFAVFMQLHRNVHFALLVILIMILHKLFFTRQKLWIKSIVYGIACVIAVFVVQNLLSNSESVVSQSVQEASTDGGGIGIRVAVLTNSFDYVVAKAPLLGIGFVWQDFDIYTIIEDLFVLAPTNDNAYTNVLLCFGFIGLILFTYLIFSLYKALSNLKKTVSKNVQVFRYTNLLALTYTLITAFGSDNFIAYNSVFIFVVIIAVLNNLNRFVHDGTVN